VDVVVELDTGLELTPRVKPADAEEALPAVLRSMAVVFYSSGFTLEYSCSVAITKPPWQGAMLSVGTFSGPWSW